MRKKWRNVYSGFLFYFLWELNPHYNKFKAHRSWFQNIVEKTFMGFKNPISHGLSLKAIDILSLILKVTKLPTHLERNENLRCHLT